MAGVRQEDSDEVRTGVESMLQTTSENIVKNVLREGQALRAEPSGNWQRAGRCAGLLSVEYCQVISVVSECGEMGTIRDRKWGYEDRRIDGHTL